jgi:methionyl-tRNA synthetase
MFIHGSFYFSRGACNMPGMTTAAEEIRPTKAGVKFDDVTKIDLRAGKVVEAADHPNADKLLVLKVDLGAETRQICAPLKYHYRPQDLAGKMVIVVANLEPRNLRGQLSEGMILVANEGPTKARVVIVSPSEEVSPGSVVS